MSLQLISPWGQIRRRLKSACFFHFFSSTLGLEEDGWFKSQVSLWIRPQCADHRCRRGHAPPPPSPIPPDGVKRFSAKMESQDESTEGHLRNPIKVPISDKLSDLVTPTIGPKTTIGPWQLKGLHFLIEIFLIKILHESTLTASTTISKPQLHSQPLLYSVQAPHSFRFLLYMHVQILYLPTYALSEHCLTNGRRN
jgi:hypothetical protein